MCSRSAPSSRRSSGHVLALRILRSSELIYLLVSIGILLRVVQYASNRSLWIDESGLALNLIEKSVIGLAGPLDFNQAAPIGFLLTEGIVARALGFSEYALRLFPLICGLLSIPAFAWLARRTLARAAAPLAILLFVVADGLVYYSSELKPYETDLAAAIGLLIVGVLVTQQAEILSVTWALALAVAGVGLVAFSFPAVFVVAAVTVALVIWLAINGRGAFSPAAGFVVLSWIITSVGILSLAGSRVRSVRESFAVSSGSFLGISGHSSPFHAVNVIGTQIAGAIGLPQERPFNHIEKLAVLVAVVGAVAVLRRMPAYFAMLVVPFPLLLVASALDLYPISQRTELFLIPAVLLLIAEGVGQLIRRTPAGAQVLAATFIAALIAAGPVWSAGKHLIQPRKHEEVRPVLEFVRDHWQQGDSLYVHYGAQYAFVYYAECGCLDLSLSNTSRSLWPVKLAPGGLSKYSPAAIPLSSDLTLGRRLRNATPGQYIKELNRAEGGRRVWFLYSNLSREDDQLAVKAMLHHLDSIGRRISGIEQPDAHAYLYRLRKPTQG